MPEETSKKKAKRPKPAVLVILDGFGVAPPNKGNAISQADTPNLDHFIATYPAMTLHASGEHVGLRWGEQGSSQVGHLNIGAGRVFYQNLMRISTSISKGGFFKNKEILAAMERVAKDKKGDRGLHLVGLLSDAGVHSYNEHLYALLEMAKKAKAKKVFVHVILDGRDSPYNSGEKFVKKLEDKMKRLGVGQIATLSGRFYAMDRNKHWDRVEKAYQAMVLGQSAEKFSDANEALRFYYQKENYDEKFPPTVMVEAGEPVGSIADGDSVIMFNFRADRMREITAALALPGFDKFERKYYSKLHVATLMQYDPYLPVHVAFANEPIKDSLSEVVSKEKLRQLHVAETEKYAHITYFFNGGNEKEFAGEERVLVPSLGSASYADTPQMGAVEITKAVLKEISKDKFDFIAINFANADMVAHTGDLKATVKAVELLDECLGKISKATLAHGGVMCITADHGNAEEVINLQTSSIDKEHGTNPVPFMIVGKDWQGQNAGIMDSMGSDLSILPIHGLLSDVAPTILAIMQIRKPKLMTGKSLLPPQ